MKTKAIIASLLEDIAQACMFSVCFGRRIAAILTVATALVMDKYMLPTPLIALAFVLGGLFVLLVPYLSVLIGVIAIAGADYLEQQDES